MTNEESQNKMQSEHLSAQLIERFRLRQEAYDDVKIMQDHITVCEQCRDHLADVTGLDELTRSFLAQFDQPLEELDHPQIATLADYATGKLDEVDTEIVELHLSICQMCSDDVLDLQPLREVK